MNGRCENCNYWKPNGNGFGECIVLFGLLRPVIPITTDMESIGLHFASSVCEAIESPDDFGCVNFSQLVEGNEFWRVKVIDRAETVRKILGRKVKHKGG